MKTLLTKPGNCNSALIPYAKLKLIDAPTTMRLNWTLRKPAVYLFVVAVAAFAVRGGVPIWEALLRDTDVTNLCSM